jgi:hypothetical protein
MADTLLILDTVDRNHYCHVQDPPEMRTTASQRIALVPDSVDVEQFQQDDPGDVATSRGPVEPQGGSDMVNHRRSEQHGTRSTGLCYSFREDTTVHREDIIGSRIARQPNGCWEYNGGNGDYCLMRPGDNRNPVRVHRWVYELLVGPIPKDHHLHHECENTRCVNPEHLTPLTPGDHRRRHAEMRQAS